MSSYPFKRINSMALNHEIEVTISSAKDLKNVNWRHGPIRPYAVVWLDSQTNCTTRVDEKGDTCPTWDQTLVISISAPINDDTTLLVGVGHAGSEEDTKPLIGVAELKLREVLDVVGFDERYEMTLQLKRLSGRPQGKVDVKVLIREPLRELHEPIYYTPPHWVTPPASRDDTAALPTYDYPDAQRPSPPNRYNNLAPPAGYPYTPYNYHSQPWYFQASYCEGSGQEEKEKSKSVRLETGLAVDASAGALGVRALAEGVDALEDHIHIEEEMAEKLRW